MEETRPEVNSEKRKSAQLAERLEELRAALRLSQREFAEVLGVSLRGYTEWMGGTRIPTSALIEAAAHFGASADWLVDGTGEMLRKKAPAPAGAPLTAIMTGAGELKPVLPGSRAATLMDALQKLAVVQAALQEELAQVIRQQEQGSSPAPRQSEEKK